MADDGGPAFGLKMFYKYCFRVLVVGGDGTVNWLFDTIEKLKLSRRPSVAIMPLGTGNDLARYLDWGESYSFAKMWDVFDKISHGSVVVLDRWNIKISGSANSERRGDQIPYDAFNNYFSVGIDAAVADQFRTMKEEHSVKFQSRMRKKLWYSEFRNTETYIATCKSLHTNLQLVCDGVPIDLTIGKKLEGICLLNIPRVCGNSDLWGENQIRKRKATSCRPICSRATVNPELHTKSQDIGDGLIEVIGLEDCTHIGGFKTISFNTSSYKTRRLAQCSTVSITTSKLLPMQLDGEPWMQPPCSIMATHKTQTPVIKAPGTGQSSSPR